MLATKPYLFPIFKKLFTTGNHNYSKIQTPNPRLDQQPAGNRPVCRDRTAHRIAAVDEKFEGSFNNRLAGRRFL